MTEPQLKTRNLPSSSFLQVRQALLDGQEIALLDVREEALFAQAHPLFAANLPLDRIARDAWVRLPRRDTPLVLYDQGEGLARQALGQLGDMGYGRVSLLEGGLAGWIGAGGEVFKDVNVPSKAFGELVEARRHTPSVSAQELKTLQASHADLVLLDARRFDEYQTMSIPGAISVPGAELLLRVQALASDPATRIVVNCAGRTRSIIGTQSLINAGIRNPVVALRNGTIGWTLAGQTLEHGASRRFTGVSESQRQQAADQARALADRAGVQRIRRADLADWLAEPSRSSYCFDVRTPEEFAAGHLSGFRHVPGGQLVQETDVSVPVRGARILLFDAKGVRDNMSASWLAQMGWEVWVLDGVTASDLTGTGPGASLAPASAAGRYRRPYEGTDQTAETIQAYLDWEYGLVAQLERDGTHGFWVL
jgi:rhodanese-related sulfurtransferase